MPSRTKTTLAGGRSSKRPVIDVTGPFTVTVPWPNTKDQPRGRTADARSGVFAFGAVLQEMVTGAAP